eukprot:440867-Pelagomonas_calceolata.AAC.1
MERECVFMDYIRKKTKYVEAGKFSLHQFKERRHWLKGKERVTERKGEKGLHSCTCLRGQLSLSERRSYASGKHLKR